MAAIAWRKADLEYSQRVNATPLVRVCRKTAMNELTTVWERVVATRKRLELLCDESVDD
jgi:hypothetical protein